MYDVGGPVLLSSKWSELSGASNVMTCDVKVNLISLIILLQVLTSLYDVGGPVLLSSSQWSELAEPVM